MPAHQYRCQRTVTVITSGGKTETGKARPQRWHSGWTMMYQLSLLPAVIRRRNSARETRALVEDDRHVSETADDVMAAFAAFLNDAAGTFGYALTGVQLARRQVQGALDFAGSGWASQ